jgi:hypothetical protein
MRNAHRSAALSPLLADGRTYVTAAGRWFRSASLAGPWDFVPGKDLPGDFARIPDTSPKENVKASVPGTRQAEEAVIANSVPQTAKIDRKSAKMTPISYDGEPQVKAIEGTPLQYVVNTATPVIMADAKSWYAVDKGIWFSATSPKGPWSVAGAVPAVIYTIPPSSPLHYVTYVKVYASTPTVVYTGYTPGYTGAVVSADYVVVYGTGYYYSPWVGAVYYPPPPTYCYGAAIRYTPWTGWTYAFGFGWSYGHTTVVVVGGCYPHWGVWYYPPYYRPPYHGGGVVVTPYGAAAWGPHGWAATTGNVYSQWGPTTAVTRSSGGYNAYSGNAWGTQVGKSYNSATGQLSAGQRAAVGNVYTGDYAAASRGATTNAKTGATTAGSKTVSGNAYTGNYQGTKQGAAYNPNSGNYAAGQSKTVGNTQTGQSATVGSGTAGNTKTGQSTDVRYASGSGGAGAAQVGDTTVGKTQEGDYYASKDGNVYKKESGGGWSQQDSGGGWKSASGSPSTTSLDQSAKARESGNLRTGNTSTYQKSKGSWGGSGSTGSRSQGGRGAAKH